MTRKTKASPSAGVPPDSRRIRPVLTVPEKTKGRVPKKFSKPFLDGLKPEATRYEVSDPGCPGFGVRVLPNGDKVFIVRYRMAGRGSTQRRAKLGTFGEVTLDQARKEARKLQGKVDTGADPIGEATEARAAMKASATVADLCARFLEEHAVVHCKPVTAYNYRQGITKKIIPSLGKLLVSQVDSGHIARLIHRLKATPYQANRTRALLSKMFSLAELWKLRPNDSNPCHGVPHFKEKKRHRSFTLDELHRIGGALDVAVANGWASPEAVLALRLLFLTGCRKSEILNLRWEWIDLEGGTIHLPDSKTGKKTVMLPPQAVELLRRAPRMVSVFVCHGPDPGKPTVNLFKPWKRILEKAGVPHARLHDVRHSFATTGVGSGLSLPLIGGLLGHSQAQTTKRYAEADIDPLKLAAAQAAAPIAEALGLA